MVHFLLLPLDWLIVLSWLMRALLWRRMLPGVPDICQVVESPQLQSLPSLTVIVPARNEAADITATLESLLASEAVDLQVIAVNDRSTDQTGACMEAVAGAKKSLLVLHVTELPSGWLGKTHAMALAAQQATGEWLLFTDADVAFRPDALRRALGFAVTSRADHMVLLPTILMRTWSERMMIACLQVLSIWAIRPWKVPDPKATRDAIGVGAFNMVRRDVYDALGGWEALRMEVLEDLALGRRVKSEGYAQRIALGLDLVSVRWANGAFGVVENLTKNLFALFSFRPARLLAFACGLTVFTLFPLAAVVVSPYPAVVLVIALFLLYQQAGSYHHFSAAQLPMFPVALVLLLYALFRSMVVALWQGGITWRSTFYSFTELRSAVLPASQTHSVRRHTRPGSS